MSTIHSATRRLFLKSACVTSATLGLTSSAWAADLPPVTDPRATDGDAAHEPKWDEQFTITVGPKKADLVGTSDRVIQTAVDTMARRGGGTVHLLPGTYIGHCDTDNILRNNRIADSGKAGVLFRDENQGRDFRPNRNLLEDNVILNSGGESGVAIDITGKTRDVQILRNEIRETRAPAKRTGIRIGPDVGRVELDRNEIEGFADAVVDQRTG